MGRFACLVQVLFARLSLALVYHVTVKGSLYCIMLQKPQSCPKGSQDLFPEKMRGVGKDRVVICPIGHQKKLDEINQPCLRCEKKLKLSVTSQN